MRQNKNIVVNYSTPDKSNYYAQASSATINQIIKLKSFASYKIVKYKNKLTMRVYDANTSTKSFWSLITKPVFIFAHSCFYWTIQGIIYVTAIPVLRLKIKIDSMKSKSYF